MPRRDSPDEDAVSLSELQIDVMRTLWRHGERSVAEVTESLQPARKLAHTTVATLLTRLEKRGLVAHKRDGRQLIYRAKVDEQQVHRSMVSGLLSSLFGGKAQALVAHLVREEEISAADLAAVRTMLAKKGAPHA